MIALHPDAETLTAWMTAIRHDIHRHPELAYAEHRTAGIIARELAAAGIDYQAGIGGTGIVATLRRGTSSRAIAFRADMDALPMDERTGLAHQSIHAGRFHGCGHDGHSAMLLGAAVALSRSGGFDGTLHFIFQPAEEGEGGAVAMLEDGLFDRFPADRVFALHNWPAAPLGQFLLRPGAMMAAFAKFDVMLQGRGGHAALPHFSTDQVLAGAALVQALQAIVARRIDPVEPAVLSVTKFHAGAAYNVLPDTAELAGCARYFSEMTGCVISDGIAHITRSVAAAYGAEAKAEFTQIYTMLVNDPVATAICREVAVAVTGDETVLTDCDPVMASDDFAFMLQRRPGCYILMGTGDHDHEMMVHHPAYDFNDRALAVGTSYWIRLAQHILS